MDCRMRLRVIAATVVCSTGIIVGLQPSSIPSPTLPAVSGASGQSRATPAGAIEVLRDEWGIPHVFSSTDAGAFYGLGYATAEDRAFQMTYMLRIIQGRLAEIVGDVRHVSRDETAVDNDKKMRTFGFYRAAGEAARRLDSPTRTLLEAYAAGVNAYFDEHRADLNPLFAQVGLQPEPWTVAGLYCRVVASRAVLCHRRHARPERLPQSNADARWSAAGRPRGSDLRRAATRRRAGCRAANRRHGRVDWTCRCRTPEHTGRRPQATVTPRLDPSSAMRGWLADAARQRARRCSSAIHRPP